MANSGTQARNIQEEAGTSYLVRKQGSSQTKPTILWLYQKTQELPERVPDGQR